MACYCELRIIVSDLSYCLVGFSLFAYMAGEKQNKTRVKNAKSRSDRAGLILPVGRFHRKLREGYYADRIAVNASVYLTAVLEYLVAEILELTGNVASQNKKARISPRHLQIAIRTDEELDKLLSNVTISEGGVLPHIPAALFPKITDRTEI
ncbi:Histone H2A-IV [Dirofilaria immitis]|nr:Histone H2A [Dirofilaria immitis]MCP9265510.1 Histone H2A [Dirofilaria immitis]